MSKLLFFGFRCCCGNVFDDLVKPDVHSAPCPECGKDGKRLVSTPTIGLSGTDPDFPGAYDKWEKTQKQMKAQDKKFYDDHGTDKMHHSYGS